MSPGCIGERRIPPARGARRDKGKKEGKREALLHAAWRRASQSGLPVRTRGGERYAVLYPGRPADGAGPDFRDAVLRAPDGTLVRGDVEIHVRPSGWRAHGHGTDPRYNGVAFHVVSSEDATRGREAAETASGRRIPLLLIGAAGERAGPPSLPTRSSRPRARDPADVLPLPAISLADAGDQRFLSRSAGIALALRTAGGDQAAWTALLEPLGYARNRRAFSVLSRRLPWTALARAASEAGPGRPEPPPVAELEELFLWAAGLAPRPSGDTVAATLATMLGTRGPKKPAWVAVGRPDNRPEARVRAAAALARRWLAAGGPLSAVIQTVRGTGTADDLIDAFVVRPRDIEDKERALVGRGRAAEIVVNAVLPLAHAWAGLTDRWDVAARALALYRAHPKLPENAVTREMRALLAARGLPAHVPGAREQQGLLFLYRVMTTHGIVRMPAAGTTDRSQDSVVPA